MKTQKVIIEIRENATVEIEFDPPAAGRAKFEKMDDTEKQLQSM